MVEAKRWLLILIIVGTGTWLAACQEDVFQPEAEDPPVQDPPAQVPPTSTDSPYLDPSIFPQPGATEFISANESELLSSGTSSNQYNGGYNARGEISVDGLMDADDEASAAPGEVAETEPEAEPDASREIVEADIFKLEGDLLYVLNRYRGLVIIDVSNPDQLEILGRLPFQAIPVEMYLRDGRAYVAMSDYFVYWQYDPDADPLGFHGSQILIVDVSDPANPIELGHQLVEGEITDTRMVGDVLYTVSKRRPDFWRYNTADWEDTTWVASLNVTNPADIREIDRITFQGTSTLIHVAHHAIFVAVWDPNYYLTDASHQQETLVTYVDISDPSGDLRERGSIYVPGTIQDKFKMDWYDHTLRVIASERAWCSRYWYGGSYGYGGYAFSCYYGGNGWLYTIDTEYPDHLQHIASVQIYTEDGEDSQSSLYATRFAEDRVYTMTTHSEYYVTYDGWTRSRGVNLLHAFDVADPADPHEDDVIEIDLRVTHLQVQGDRVLALGQRMEWYREESTGIWRAYSDKVQLSLYEDGELGLINLSTEHLGMGYSYSVANNDYKALRVIPEMELILVPLQYSYWTNTGYYERFNGVQLVDWIDDDLIERGRAQTIGRVLRAFPVGERIVAVSADHVETIDPTNRDEPVNTAVRHLQRTVYEVFEFDGLEVQLVGPDMVGGLRFDVLQFNKEDDDPILTSLPLPFSGAPSCFRDGDVIHMIGWETNRGQVIRNAVFEDPLDPRLVGLLELNDSLSRIYSGTQYYYDPFYAGGVGYYWRYWNPYAGLPQRNQLLPFTVRRIKEDVTGRRDWESELRIVDMSDPENPRIADGTLPMNDFPFINKVTHGAVLFSSHVEQATNSAGESLLYHVRAYVDRVDVSDPDHPVTLPSLNVPGWLIDVSDDGTLLYTVDYQWDDFGRRRNSLNILKVVGDVAVLMDVLPVGDQVNRAVFRDRTIWMTTHKYPWWGVRGETAASRQPYTILQRVDINTDGRIVGQSTASMHGYHFNLLDVESDVAYLASTGPYGVLILDVDNPVDPTMLNASRSIGYVSRFVRHVDHIYMPLGAYGVHRLAVTELTE
ncbi:MAG: beta-propeller domain-containing protein [Bradymonadales bacterium]|nr:beta-propeller domain-containing protein [Bradymonadales bacterium]